MYDAVATRNPRDIHVLRESSTGGNTHVDARINKVHWVQAPFRQWSRDCRTVQDAGTETKISIVKEVGTVRLVKPLARRLDRERRPCHVVPKVIVCKVDHIRAKTQCRIQWVGHNVLRGTHHAVSSVVPYLELFGIKYKMHIETTGSIVTLFDLIPQHTDLLFDVLSRLDARTVHTRVRERTV